MDQVHHFIGQSFQLSLKDTLLIEMDYVQIYLFIKITNEEICTQLLIQCEDSVKYTIETATYGSSVDIVDNPFTIVNVTPVPLELDYYYVIQAISQYGNVYDVIEEKFERSYF